MNEVITRPALRETLRNMEIGEMISIAFEVTKPRILRNCASILGTEMGRRYSVHADRHVQMTKVTRHE